MGSSQVQSKVEAPRYAYTCYMRSLLEVFLPLSIYSREIHILILEIHKIHFSPFCFLLAGAQER
jgi:hypothetical protein